MVGAGSSGITAIKALAERDIPFDCYERGDRVGGNWVFANSNGWSSAYASLCINTSRERMEYRDFPMPRSYPDYPHHTQIAAYFDAYVDHFGLRDRITFATTVERARRDPRGGWRVTLDDGRTRDYDVLVVANGHHWDPRWPEPAIPGTGDFAGEVIHAHDYRDRDQLEGRDVVVLGMGNSAVDIAVEASECARSTTLAARRGAHVLPRYLFGRPSDQVGATLNLPVPVRRQVFAALYRVAVGRPEDLGLPRPQHNILSAHPTMSSELPKRVADGRIAVKPGITRLDGDRVAFADGSAVRADLVVFATGYRITFPFLDTDLVAAPGNRIGLFHRVFDPRYDDIAFVGLLQPLGAVMPLAEAQSRWIADWLVGRYALPSRRRMAAWIAQDRQRMARRYVASPRHTIQVDFDDYLAALTRERQAGEHRALVGV